VLVLALKCGCGFTVISQCVFSGKAFAPEFYYDTYSALWQNKPRVYGFKLQWTQMNPNAVDRIMAYRLGIKQVSVSEHLLKDYIISGMFWNS